MARVVIAGPCDCCEPGSSGSSSVIPSAPNPCCPGILLPGYLYATITATYVKCVGAFVVGTVIPLQRINLTAGGFVYQGFNGCPGYFRLSGACNVVGGSHFIGVTVEWMSQPWPTASSNSNRALSGVVSSLPCSSWSPINFSMNLASNIDAPPGSFACCPGANGFDGSGIDVQITA